MDNTLFNGTRGARGWRRELSVLADADTRGSGVFEGALKHLRREAAVV